MKRELKTLLNFAPQNLDDSNIRQQFNDLCENAEVSAKDVGIDPMAVEITLILHELQMLSSEVASFCHCHCDTSLSEQVCHEMNEKLKIAERKKAKNEIIKLASKAIIHAYDRSLQEVRSDFGLAGHWESSISELEVLIEQGSYSSVFDESKRPMLMGVDLRYQPKSVSYEQIIESGKNCACPANKAVEFRPFDRRLRVGSTGNWVISE